MVKSLILTVCILFYSLEYRICFTYDDSKNDFDGQNGLSLKMA